MRIGLVDVDGRGKKKKWGATIYPNIALAKIARYHRQQGDTVEWAFAFQHYDRIFWPVIDPDIPSHPYCRKCLDKAKMELMIKLFGKEE